MTSEAKRLTHVSVSRFHTLVPHLLLSPSTLELVLHPFFITIMSISRLPTTVHTAQSGLVLAFPWRTSAISARERRDFVRNAMMGSIHIQEIKDMVEVRVVPCFTRSDSRSFTSDNSGTGGQRCGHDDS